MTNNFIHSFGRSILSALLGMNGKTCQSFDNDEISVRVLLDLAKAFDTVKSF